MTLEAMSLATCSDEPRNVLHLVKEYRAYI